jgi:RNA polymerase sigma-70 factor (ECF subfamily)
MLSENDIQNLVKACQDGDKPSFGPLYDHFVDRIYRYVYFKVHKDEVEDLTEIIFVKVWENIQRYTPGKTLFSSWIFRIAHNVVVDHYRTRRTVSELVDEYRDEHRQHQPLHVTERKLNAELLRGALADLKDEYQQVLILRFMNHCTNAEMAEILGKSEVGLRVLQHRALKALRKVLDDRGLQFDL